MGLQSAARFYSQLGIIHRAGIPIADSISHAGSVSGGRHQRLAPSWSAGCRAGGAVAEQLAASHEPPMAVALIRAGERSGRIPEIARMLGEYYQHLIDIRSTAIARLIYPVLLLHAALMVLALPGVVMGTSPPYMLLAGPAALWGLAALGVGVFLFTRQSGLLGRLSLSFPLRFLVMPLICANSYRCLEAACIAGMLVPESLELTAGATVVQEMSRRMEEAARGVRDGSVPNLAEALGRCGFPTLDVGLVRNGEFAGKTEEVLGQVSVLALESFRMRSMWTAKIMTGTVYTIVAVTVGYVVISVYGGYLGQVKEIANDGG
jgi:general secretion pathway protein F